MTVDGGLIKILTYSKIQGMGNVTAKINFIVVIVMMSLLEGCTNKRIFFILCVEIVMSVITGMTYKDTVFILWWYHNEN